MSDEKPDLEDKTEDPTETRKKEMKEKGQVMRSKELTTVGSLVLGFGLIYTMSAPVVQSCQQMLAEGLLLRRWQIFARDDLAAPLWDALRDVMVTVMPLWAIMMVGTVVLSLSFGGWSMSSHPLALNMGRLNPLSGLARMVSMKSLYELAKALLKVSLGLGMLFFLLWKHFPMLLGLASWDLSYGFTRMGSFVSWNTWFLCWALSVVLIMDLPYQWKEYQTMMKMTKDEVKQDYKNTEGKPEVKAKIKQKQREVSQRSLPKAIAEADVVLVNPTHYACALKYDRQKMAVPVLVAKGADLISARIRSLADEHDVPIVSMPLLTRALFYTTAVGKEIPHELYTAVAQVLAYIHHLERYHRGLGGQPDALTTVDIPDSMQHY